MKNLTNLSIVCATLGLAGCSTASGAHQRDLDNARAVWAEAGTTAYRIREVKSCFCPLGGRAVDVEVAGDSVVSLTLVETGGLLVENQSLGFVTVGGLFDVLQDAIDRGPHRYAVTYHETLGYPVTFSIDYIEQAVDEEFGMTVQELVAG